MDNGQSFHSNHRRSNRPPQRTNAFIDLNGLPYLLGEYLDTDSFRIIDRSMIRTEVNINKDESMRAIVDINIDDIGKRQDGLLKIVGNNTKQNHLIRMIERHAKHLKQRLDIIQQGIIIRINYQLENQRTKKVIRSTSEDLPIKDRSYFIDVNSRNIDDNGLIANFSDSIVSTINNFTHGTDRMMLRITSVQLLYEGLRRDGPKMISERISTFPYYDQDEFIPDVDFNPYAHHQKYSSRQFITDDGGSCDCGDGYPNSILPKSWVLFNRFYHFDNVTKDIVLHMNEIQDRLNRKIMIPCGTIHVNRSFMINPGHRIVFRINVWKNDVIAVADTTRIAKALGVQYFGDIRPNKDHDLRKLIIQQSKLIKQMEEELILLKEEISSGCECEPIEDDILPCDKCGQIECICEEEDQCCCCNNECNCNLIICNDCGEDPCICEPVDPVIPSGCNCKEYVGMPSDRIKEILNGNWIK